MTPFAKFLTTIEPLLCQRGAAWRRKTLELVEWLDSTRGQGSGPMGSGGDGPKFPACPVCGGIHESGSIEFIASAIGHKPTCVLKKLIERE